MSRGMSVTCREKGAKEERKHQCMHEATDCTEWDVSLASW